MTRDTLFTRATLRLFGPGYGAELPFPLRYGWAVPVITWGSIAVVTVTVFVMTIRGLGPLLVWIGIGIAVASGLGVLIHWMRTRGRDEVALLPALNRTPRTATVTANEEVDVMTGWPGVFVTYRGRDRRRHEVHLADHIDDSWLDRFPVGSTWQVYAFEDPALANTVVFLTEEHDDVWRSGTYLWLGVRGIVYTSRFAKPRPGSRFFGEGSKQRFET